MLFVMIIPKTDFSLFVVFFYFGLSLILADADVGLAFIQAA
jgi:hypothetical protein